MRCCLLLVALLMIGLFVFASIARADSISYSPDGQAVYVIHNGVETTIHEPNVIAFTWMDNTSALMNRTDYGILIINVITNQVFWLGYNYPDDYCSPCNIGGEG